MSYSMVHPELRLFLIALQNRSFVVDFGGLFYVMTSLVYPFLTFLVSYLNQGCHNAKKPSKIDHNGSILEGY